MNTYRRLRQDERETVSQGLAMGLKIRDIAKSLGRSPSSISREIARNGVTGSTYRAFHAQQRADDETQKHHRVRKIESNPPLSAIIFEKLTRRWSPEQIARHLRQSYPTDRTMQVSHETIYTYIYLQPRGELRRLLARQLRHRKKHRQRRGTVKDRRGSIQDMISIDERPPEVADRTVPGHWEGDLIMGKWNRTALGTLVERTTRAVILVPLTGKDATDVREAFEFELKDLPEQMRCSMTYDQGKEMAEHRLFTANTKMVVYFAHPHSPWERGTSENTNMLVRDFFPKGTDFSKVTRRDIKYVQGLLNERPRKKLNWRTPDEVLCELIGRPRMMQL